MAHVQITLGSSKTIVRVDGVDISKSVLAEGFEVDLQSTPAAVRMTVSANLLEVDLPDATVDTEVLTTNRRLCDPDVPIDTEFERFTHRVGSSASGVTDNPMSLAKSAARRDAMVRHAQRFDKHLADIASELRKSRGDMKSAARGKR